MIEVVNRRLFGSCCRSVENHVVVIDFEVLFGFIDSRPVGLNTLFQSHYMMMKVTLFLQMMGRYGSELLFGNARLERESHDILNVVVLDVLV